MDEVLRIPGNGQCQIKNGYKFTVYDKSSFYDWFNAYFEVQFQLQKLADGSGYAAKIHWVSNTCLRILKEIQTVIHTKRAHRTLLTRSNLMNHHWQIAFLSVVTAYSIQRRSTTPKWSKVGVYNHSMSNAMRKKGLQHSKLTLTN